MGKSFERTDEFTLPADPQEVWAAIATGPGHDAWFLGHNEVTGGVGGCATTDFGGGGMPPNVVSVWEPGQRLTLGMPTSPEGRFLANDYLIEAADGGGSVLKIVTSGFLPGDDWEDEYEGMLSGMCLFRSTLAEYLTHFAGRKALPVTAFGPKVVDWNAAWTAFDERLGLAGHERGQQVTLAGEPASLYAANDQVRGFRTDRAMYRVLQAFHGPVMVSHHVFDPSADERTETARWSAWLAETF